jgi:hypothetical protein
MRYRRLICAHARTRLLNKALTLELARCEWTDKRQECIALGQSGTGDTHIGFALDPVAQNLNSLVACPLSGRT